MTSTEIESLFNSIKNHSFSIKTHPIESRKALLLKLLEKIISSRSEIQKALYADFKKPASESDITEILVTISEAKLAIRNLKKWSKPVRVSTPLAVFGTKSWIYKEPKGTVLLIGPWNYPFALMMIPLISAIAAGNCVIMKPSEFTPNINAVLKKIIKESLPADEVAFIEGGVNVSTKLLELPFDHIFFTGSTSVGKIVMQAAAKNLASVTLELGGKSPAILDESADLKAAAKAICWGKFVNAGQTCVAPDYVLLPSGKTSKFVEALTESLNELYPDRNYNDLCRIISPNHFNRLKVLLESSVKAGAQLALGGQLDSKDLFISPTVLTGVLEDHPIMKEEIFGPILPIMEFGKLDDAIWYVNKNEKPLALYIFSKNSEKTKHILEWSSAGGTCINNTLVHLANHNLPFGGTGPSGFGRYHGKFGFEEFSHHRAVMKQGLINPFKNFYPPYNEKVQKLVNFALRFLT